MNDSGYLGPAQGILATEQLRSQLEAAIQRAEQAEAVAVRLHEIIQEKTLRNIDRAAWIQELQDENERLRAELETRKE